MTGMTEIPTLDADATFPAYVAGKDGEGRAAIIVIPEIFGVNAGIRAKCDAWAKEGYLAAAPDIFWRFAAGEELDPDVPDQLQKAFDNMGKFDPDACVRDIEALIHWLKRERGCTKVGLVGFCLGGRMAYMAATRTDIDVRHLKAVEANHQAGMCGRNWNPCTSVRYTDGKAAVPHTPVLMRRPDNERTNTAARPWMA